MGELWIKGKYSQLEKKTRILVAGPKGAGKKTLMWALNHYFVKNGQNLSKKELAQLKFRVDEFDDGVIMTSIPFQGTELIFCVGEILYNWIPIYRKAPAWDLIFCVDVSILLLLLYQGQVLLGKNAQKIMTIFMECLERLKRKL